MDITPANKDFPVLCKLKIKEKLKMDLSLHTLNDLSSSYGSSFYLFDKSKFVRNIEKFRAGFDQLYSNFEVAYSLKTNYMPAICKLAKEYNVLAEVVSGMEYEIARRNGYEGSDIIFNGPVKDEEELYRAFEEGAIVQFDSKEEIVLLKKYLARKPGKEVKCAIRCNFDIGASGASRFGMDAGSGEVEARYEELFSIKGCKPVGIHCHFSTRNRSLSSYKKRTEKLIILAKRIFKGHKLHYINIGGGFFGELPASIKSQYSGEITSFNEYGKVVGGIMKVNFPDQSVRLITEPGMALVANTMSFICRVASVKFISSTPIITVTGSIQNIQPVKSSINLPFRVVKSSGHSHSIKNGIIGGYTCMESDILCESYSGELSVGDYLIFEQVGGYSIVLKPPFIKGLPPILMCEEEGGKINSNVEVIKERESADSIMRVFKY